MHARFPALIIATFLFLPLVWIVPHVMHVSALEAQESQQVPTAGGQVRIPILIYHSVRPDGAYERQDQIAYSVTPEQFDEQLTYIEDHGFTPVSMDQLVEIVRNGTTTTAVPKPVVITFDDGWENQFVYALPLLQKHHMHAMFYIYTNPISKDERFLTWGQISALQHYGMEIGSHSLSHPYFFDLTPEQMHQEVFGSKRILEEKLGTPIKHFASPFGYASSSLDTLVTEAGYETGRSTYDGATHDVQDLIHLHGFLVHRDMAGFAWALEKAQ